MTKFVNCVRDYGKEIDSYKGFKVLRKDEFLLMYWESMPYDGLQIKNLNTGKFVYILRAPANNFFNGNPKEVWEIIETIRKRHEQQK